MCETLVCAIRATRSGRSATQGRLGSMCIGSHSGVPSGDGRVVLVLLVPVKTKRMIPALVWVSMVMVPQRRKASIAVRPVSSWTSRRAASSIVSPRSTCPPRPLYKLGHIGFVGAPLSKRMWSSLVIRMRVLGMSV